MWCELRGGHGIEEFPVAVASAAAAHIVIQTQRAELLAVRPPHPSFGDVGSPVKPRRKPSSGSAADAEGGPGSHGQAKTRLLAAL